MSKSYHQATGDKLSSPVVYRRFGERTDSIFSVEELPSSSRRQAKLWAYMSQNNLMYVVCIIFINKKSMTTQSVLYTGSANAHMNIEPNQKRKESGLKIRVQ
jgi:hypothetical protein